MAKRKRYGSFAWTDPKTKYLYARVRVKLPDGKFKVIYKRAINKTHAEQIALEIKAEYETRGQAFLDGRTLTLKDFAEWYKNEVVIPAVYADGVKVDGMRTWASERKKIDRIMLKLGHHLINDFNEDHARAYKRERIKSGMKIATVNRDLETLRAIFNKAIKKKLRKEVIDFSDLIQKSLEKRRQVTITDDEETRLLDAARGYTLSPRIYALILALRDSGARPNELYPVNDHDSDYTDEGTTFYEPIRWRDLFDGGEIKDISVLVSYKGKQREDRLCVVTERMKDAFLDLWAFLKNSRNTSAEHGAHLDNLVFPHTTYKKAWDVVRTKANCPGVRLRDLRRDWVTRLARLGYSDKLAQRGAGHTQMQMSYQYTEFDREAALQAKQLLDADNITDTVQ